MATRMERFDEFKKLAEDNIVERRDAATVYGTLALATAVVRVGDLLAEHNTQLTELVRLAREGREAWDASTESTRRCNEMGGGSSGINTVDDFEMHCEYKDGHDGPHSYEEE